MDKTWSISISPYKRAFLQQLPLSGLYKMTISKRDQHFLTYLNEAKTRHPDLIELLAFYEQLSRAQCEFMAEVDKDSFPANRELNFSRLTEGVPQFTFEELLINREDFLRLSIRMAGIITKHMPQYGTGGGVTTDEVLLKIAQTIFESRKPVVLSDAPPNVTSLTAGLALIPYLQRACGAMVALIPQDSWERPYCPVCGGKPSFAALDKESGARSLLCSRCNAEWLFGRIGCAFCESTEKQLYYPGEDGLYRLYVCDVCKRYLKTIDLRQAGRDLYLPVECIVTVSMDIAAQEKGYRHY